MALNIKNEETCELVQELAQLTGENMTEAITNAVRERLERAKHRKKVEEGMAEKLMRIARESAPLWKEPFKSTPHGELLYDEKGLPK
jgi:antitoxin VapB